MQPSRQDLWFI